MKLVSSLPTAFFLTFVLGAVTTGAMRCNGLSRIAETPSPQLTSPTATAKPVPSQQTQRPYLGIQMVTLTPKTAQQMNLKPNIGFKVPETEGVLIWSVLPNTPAASAGLQQGDLIAKVSGQQVTTAEQVAQLVANSHIGESLSFTVQRGSQTIPISIRPEQQPTTSDKK